MRRGTTPTLSFTVNAVDLSQMQTVILTIVQSDGYKMLKRAWVDDVIVTEHQFSVKLTQKETLKFKTGRARCQIRGVSKQGDAFATDIVTINFEDVLYDEVI